MESLITRHFIFGLLLSLARGASTNVTSCSETEEISIQQLTEPEEGVYNPLWDASSGKLYYMNPWLQRIYLLDPATGELTYAYIENGILGVMVPVDGESDQFVVGAGRDFALVSWDTNVNCTEPTIEVLGTVETNKTSNLIKGGKADPSGRLWAGTMGPPENVTAENPSGITPNQAAVYRLTADRVIKTVISPVSITRGMAWNKAGTTFYFVDTPTLNITAYDFDAEHGEISNGRIVFDFTSHNISGRPGGITVDTDDNLWIANYYEGSVIKVDPVEGSVLQIIELPVGKVTDVTWGGEDFDILDNPKNEHLIIEQINDPVHYAKNPHWDHRSGKLYFVNVFMREIYRLDPASGELTHAYIANGPVGVVVPVDGKPDKFIVGAGKDFALVTWDSGTNCSNPVIKVLGTVDKDRNVTHFNNGKVDSHGRLWAGTEGRSNASSRGTFEPNKGSLYRLTSDRVIKRYISPVSIGNGIAWNKKNTRMYYADILSRQIAGYDFDARRGKISNKRIVFDLTSQNISGRPNGMTIDRNDNLWVALYNGGNVINIDPVRGKLLQSVKIPASLVSSVTWGGRSFDILYVVTSRNRLTPEEIATEPRTGSIFAIKGLGARGYAENLFSLKRRNFY